MDVRFFDDAYGFSSGTTDFLLEHEAENHIIFGITHDVAQGRYAGPVFATVEHDRTVVLAALMTPPHNLLVSVCTADGAIEALAEALRARRAQLPGVGGRDREARAFADTWGDPTLRMRQRIMALREVRTPAGADGVLRQAQPDDVDLLAGWFGAFSREAVGAEEQPERSLIRARSLVTGDPQRFAVLWETSGGPVSMALATGPTPNGIRIGAVYTVPEFRRRGYGSACVAALSRIVLSSGKTFCFLYTDASNPTSNHIYETIGYDFVCDAAEYRFPSGEGIRPATS